MDNVFEQAVLDFYKGSSKGDLLIHNTYGEPDEMPLEVYFRNEEDFTELELKAIEFCRGSVLEVGAGVGAVSFLLQNLEFEVEALEISPALCSIMQEAGLQKIHQKDIFKETGLGKYNTLLLLMNGFGICGSFENIPGFFKALDQHLAPGGQIIFDSSNISYLYDGEKPTDKYFGELDYQYEYDGKLGEWFKWLYIDSDTLSTEAKKHGFDLEVMFTEDSGQYLGRLTKSKI